MHGQRKPLEGLWDRRDPGAAGLGRSLPLCISNKLQVLPLLLLVHGPLSEEHLLITCAWPLLIKHPSL